MSDQTPSQAEGERTDEQPEGGTGRRGRPEDHPDVPRTTPSQAEGERDDDADAE